MKRDKVLLKLWHLRCMRATKQHYWSVLLFRFFDKALTTINISAAIVVLFIGLLYRSNSTTSLAWASVVVLVTSILHIVFDWRSRWRSHEKSGTTYAALNRWIEITDPKGENLPSNLDILRNKLDDATTFAATVPLFFWNRPKYLTKKILEAERLLDDDSDET